MPSLSRAFVLATLVASASAEAPPSSPRATYSKTSFIAPASPTLVSPIKSSRPNNNAGWPSALNHPSRAQQQIVNGYGTYQSASTTSLHGKKKKGGGGGGSAGQPVANKKGQIQVVMLETVPNVGQSGDIIFVSSPVFQNQLQLTKKARLISAEEVAKIEAEEAAEQAEATEMAKKTKGMMEKVMSYNNEKDGGSDDTCGVALAMKRKAGPEGNLFGGVNPKMVMDALKKEYPEGSWDGKQVKLTDVKDKDGKDVKKKDIKHTGDYTMSVALGNGVDVTFILAIGAE